jgi:hypothetical protein
MIKIKIIYQIMSDKSDSDGKGKLFHQSMPQKVISYPFIIALPFSLFIQIMMNFHYIQANNYEDIIEDVEKVVINSKIIKKQEFDVMRLPETRGLKFKVDGLNDSNQTAKFEIYEEHEGAYKISLKSNAI